MKVVHKSDATRPVSDVMYGQCFMKNGSILMKAYHDFDYAVDLNDGRLYRLYDMKDQVIPVEAEVVVE